MHQVQVVRLHRQGIEQGRDQPYRGSDSGQICRKPGRRCPTIIVFGRQCRPTQGHGIPGRQTRLALPERTLHQGRHQGS